MYETWKGYSILEQAQSHFCRRLYFYGNKNTAWSSLFLRDYIVKIRSEVQIHPVVFIFGKSELKYT